MYFKNIFYYFLFIWKNMCSCMFSYNIVGMKVSLFVTFHGFKSQPFRLVWFMGYMSFGLWCAFVHFGCICWLCICISRIHSKWFSYRFRFRLLSLEIQNTYLHIRIIKCSFPVFDFDVITNRNHHKNERIMCGARTPIFGAWNAAIKMKHIHVLLFPSFQFDY